MAPVPIQRMGSSCDGDLDQSLLAERRTSQLLSAAQPRIPALVSTPPDLWMLASVVFPGGRGICVICGQGF